MALLDTLVASGKGKKFAVAKPKVAPVHTGPKARKGYTFAGYPIAWLKSCSHDECVAHLAAGTRPSRSSTAARVKLADTGETVSTDRDGSWYRTLSLEGQQVDLGFDKRNYIIRHKGVHRYYSSFGGILSCLADLLTRSSLGQSESALTLGEMRQTFERVSQTIQEQGNQWAPDRTAE